jgi:hypothetical protein
MGSEHQNTLIHVIKTLLGHVTIRSRAMPTRGPLNSHKLSEKKKTMIKNLQFLLQFNCCSTGQPTQMDDTSNVTETARANFNVYIH